MIVVDREGKIWEWKKKKRTKGNLIFVAFIGGAAIVRREGKKKKRGKSGGREGRS